VNDCNVRTGDPCRCQRYVGDCVRCGREVAVTHGERAPGLRIGENQRLVGYTCVRCR
jgi:hypothetical protein